MVPESECAIVRRCARTCPAAPFKRTRLYEVPHATRNSRADASIPQPKGSSSSTDRRRAGCQHPIGLAAQLQKPPPLSSRPQGRALTHFTRHSNRHAAVLNLKVSCRLPRRTPVGIPSDLSLASRATAHARHRHLLRSRCTAAATSALQSKRRDAHPTRHRPHRRLEAWTSFARTLDSGWCSSLAYLAAKPVCPPVSPLPFT